MKQNKSFFGKLLGKKLIELEPGDIFYFKSAKAYWVYIGEEEIITENIDENYKPEDISGDGCVYLLHGINALDYIKKLSFNKELMYKVNDDIIFHFKFIHNRSIDSINKAYKENDAIYIMTLKEEELKALKAAFTLFTIKESK